MGNPVTDDVLDGNGQMTFAAAMGYVDPPTWAAMREACADMFWNATQGGCRGGGRDGVGAGWVGSDKAERPWRLEAGGGGLDVKGCCARKCRPGPLPASRLAPSPAPLHTCDA